MVWIRSTCDRIGIFLEMIKWQHSVFALPFAYLGLLLAEEGRPRFDLFCWITLAMVAFRTMAMGLNRLIDVPLDRENPRTKEWALPAGRLSASFVWALTFFAFVIFECTAYGLRPICFWLSPVPVLLALVYPWLKRFTWLSHFVLGMILGIAPYGAWLASRGEFGWVPGWLGIGVATWVSGFDIIYSLQDAEFDRRYGLHSFPVRYGQEASLRAVQILHGISVISWIGVGLLAGLGNVYFLGIVLITLFLVREHWLIRSFGLEKLEEAFFGMNAVVSVSILVAAVADYAVGRL